MRKIPGGIFKALCFAFIFVSLFSCNPDKEKDITTTMKQELQKIDSLLRDKAFTASMAASLDSAYYIGTGQSAPPFFSLEDDSAKLTISKKDEKIATNLSGFYALECGLELLCNSTNEKPSVWLDRIATGNLDSNSNLLLNRFANATWKAAQPFRDLERITRPNFIGASQLSQKEIHKDEMQIKNAALKLNMSIKPLADLSTEEQMTQLQKLMQDTGYAVEMASWLDSCYYAGINEKGPPFLSAGDESTTISKNVKDIKIATNVAGFYALEGGINYLATTKNILPSEILLAINEDKLDVKDKYLFARLANATWKSGQPFRGLSRITREVFRPFYFLDDTEIDKDFVQIKNAAAVLYKAL